MAEYLIREKVNPSNVFEMNVDEMFGFAFECLQRLDDKTHAYLLTENNVFTYFDGATETESDTEIIETPYGAEKILEASGYDISKIK